jgi:hypothetical protein
MERWDTCFAMSVMRELKVKGKRRKGKEEREKAKVKE